jgi:hypothetical protein
MIQKIVVVNPPYFIGIIWKVVKFLLKEKQQKLLYFNKGTSLFDFVDRDVVPVAYGGNRKVIKSVPREECKKSCHSMAQCNWTLTH